MEQNTHQGAANEQLVGAVMLSEGQKYEMGLPTRKKEAENEMSRQDH